ncbi:MAG: tetraacyldisaccharide 4'-kinase [Sideroxydans sp.]|nr:tetraacyldisaccharide 4'-kinase [Sideroxydans sp.]
MDRLQQYWYRISPLHLILYPISLLFRALVAIRRFLYLTGLAHSVKLPVPVIIIGNINVGGTGKTPLTLSLAQQLLSAGWHPAIISRGYRKSGQTSAVTAREVLANDSADEVGDEPLLMRRRDLCPVWIGQDRPAVAQALLKAYPACDIILSDDGLQHYRLQRDIELVVVDGVRRFGNKLMLPAGPLREPLARLGSVDAIIVNGGIAKEGEFPMHLEGAHFYNLLAPQKTIPATALFGQNIHACAGIGHPQRFFQHLKALGLECTPHPFPDHHQYSHNDLLFEAVDAVLLTEKDAVKCAPFATDKFWVLRVDAHVSPALTQLIIDKVSP